MNFFVRAVGQRQPVDDYNSAIMAKRAKRTSTALPRILLNLPSSPATKEQEVLGGVGESNLRSSFAKIGEAWKHLPAVSCTNEYAGPVFVDMVCQKGTWHEIRRRLFALPDTADHFNDVEGIGAEPNHGRSATDYLISRKWAYQVDEHCEYQRELSHGVGISCWRALAFVYLPANPYY
jgi:hypothetical protein